MRSPRYTGGFKTWIANRGKPNGGFTPTAADAYDPPQTRRGKAMKAKALMLAVAVTALGGCNLIGGGATADDSAAAENVAGAAGNGVADAQPGGDKRAGGGEGAPGQPGDAGITNSRSLQAFSGNGGAMPDGAALGGKEGIGGGSGGGSSGGGIISPQALVGRWADNPDCSMDVTFFADGTFRSFNGGGGNWRLNGNSLNLAGGGGSYDMEILSYDGQVMQLRNPDGSIGRSRRC